MRATIALLLATSCLASSRQAAAQTWSSEQAIVLVSFEPSAFADEVRRQRVRLIRLALRSFARSSQVALSGAARCADPTASDESLGEDQVDCARSAADEMSRVASTVLEERSPIMVVIFADQRPDLTYDPVYDDAVFLDVASTEPGQLVLQICQLTASVEGQCRLRQEVESLSHPDGVAFSVGQRPDHRVGVTRMLRGRVDERELSFGPLLGESTSPFVVQRGHGEFRLEAPTPVWSRWELGALHFRYSQATKDAIRNGWVVISAIHDDGDPEELRLWTQRHDETAYSVIWPHGGLGTHRIGVALAVPESYEPIVESTIEWTNLGTVTAGDFLECRVVPEDWDATSGWETNWEQLAFGVETVSDGDRYCAYIPWWRSHAGRFRMWPDTTGRFVADPSVRLFPWLVWLFAWLGLWLALRGPRPKRLGCRVGARESYREAPASAWVVDEVGAALMDGASFRVLRTPLGPLVWARHAVLVRARHGLFSRRRLFFAEPEQLVVSDEVQVVFLRPGDGAPDEHWLADTLASKTDIRQAPEEEYIAITASRSARLVSFIRLSLGSLGLTGAALYLVAASGVPTLTQRAPYVACVMGIVLGALVLVRYRSRRRRSALALALLAVVFGQALSPGSASAFEDAREMEVQDWMSALVQSGNEDADQFLSGVRFTIETVPSALEEPVHRQRIQLFRYALERVFQRLGWVSVSPSTECARLRDPSALPSCADMSVEPMDDEPIRVVLHARGDLPEHALTEDVIALDVAALTSSALAMRACELSHALIPTRCRLSDGPVSLQHPLDAGLQISADDGGVYHASHEEFGGERSALFRDATEPESFAVLSEVDWRSLPEISEARIDAGTSTLAPRFEWQLQAVTSYLLRRRALELQVFLGDERVLPRVYDAHLFETHIEVVPEGPRGDRELRLELVVPSTGEVLVEGHERWTSLDAIQAGAFSDCSEHWRAPLNLQGVVQEEGGCVYSPWWSPSRSPVLLPPRSFGHTTPDPWFAIFVGLVSVLAWAGAARVLRRREDPELREAIRDLSRTSSARLQRLARLAVIGGLAVAYTFACVAAVATVAGPTLSQRGPFAASVAGLVLVGLVWLGAANRSPRSLHDASVSNVSLRAH